MRILIIGKNGQLGQSIKNSIFKCNSHYEYHFVGKEDLNLESPEEISIFFKKNKFSTIINCAAYTNVDNAEDESLLANQINNIAVAEIAIQAKKNNSKLVHISTDYVFDGSKKINFEDDTTCPINTYGKTKSDGEKAIKKIMSKNALILRTSWVYSKYGNNFVKTMIRIGKEKNEINVVNDQLGSPTNADDLADTVLHIIDHHNFKSNFLTEIYHFSNEGFISWYDFAKRIYEITNINCNVKPISSDQFPTKAKRPKNSLMSKEKIVNKFNIKLVSWDEALKKHLQTY